MRPRTIAHRGAASECPENTLPAFRRALELGADGIELDVHATSDGRIVVHHDPTIHLPLSSDGSGKRAIVDITMRELSDGIAAVDAGVPSLDEVLDLVGDRADVYVELKGIGVEGAVADVIQHSRASHRCAVHSFDHVAVLRFGRIAPHIPTGVLLSSRLADPVGALRAADARDYWIQWMWADTELVDAIHGAGGRVIAWTPPDENSFRALAALGVDAICADDVGRLRSALEVK